MPKVIKRGDDEPRCGQCKWWRKRDPQVGECYFNPPIVHMDEEGPTMLRPLLEVSEYACANFWGDQ